MLGSSPDRYTCDCTGTNFIGVNCSGKEILMIRMISSHKVVYYNNYNNYNNYYNDYDNYNNHNDY